MEYSNGRAQAGFALPTVMIASIVMLMVLLSGLVATSSIDSSLKQQYYKRLTNEAVQSGVIMAKTCIIQSGKPLWTGASPLRPDTGCSGSTTACAAKCNLVDNSNLKTTFSVGAPTLSSDGSYAFTVSGSVNQYQSRTATVSTTTTIASQSKASIGWKQFTMGESFGCGITLTDNLDCWGRNDFLQLGNGDTSTSTIAYNPTPVYTGGALSGKTIQKVYSGNYSSCAISTDGLLYCWGGNTQGQLGNGTTTHSSVPVQVGGLLAGKVVTDVSIGYATTCAIANNDAYCWGSTQDPSGTLGNNTFSGSTTPTAVYKGGALSGLTIKNIAVGKSNACVIASNNLPYCWGSNSDYTVGNNSSIDVSVPTAVYTGGALAGKTIKALSLYYSYACVIASDDKAYCWGRNDYGQLGNNSTAVSGVPVAVYTGGVLSGKVVTAISAGQLTSCAIASGLAYCWGENSVGTLGNNSTTNSAIPIAVNTGGILAGKTLNGISARFGPACAFANSDNRFYCWGSNYQSYFGRYPVSSTLVPIAGGAVAGGLYY